MPLVHAEESPARPWRLGVIAGIGTDGGIEGVPTFNYNVEDSYFASVILARELTRFGTAAALEAEGQIVKHFNKQDHWEFNALIVLRWLRFPWDHIIDTSAAIGEGLSYATEIPTIEAERTDKNNRWLNYLLFEVEFRLPDYPRWSVAARVHHRSGVYGLYNGVSYGSNFLALGVKYDF